MRFTKILPQKNLKDFVDYYFIMGPDKPCSRVCEDNVVIGPGGNFNIIFNMGECEWIKCGKTIELKKGRAYFLGQLTGYDKFKFNKRTGLIGAALSPYCFSRIIDIPAYRLTDKLVEAIEILPDIESFLGKENGEDICEDPHKAVNALSDYIFKKTAAVKSDEKKELIRSACNLVKLFPEEMTPAKLADELGISQRLLEMRFREMVGIMPGKYINIFKIYMIVELIQTGRPGINLSEIANKFGFYDQSHFSREYKKVTSLSPKKHIRNAIRRLLHFEVISDGKKQNVPADILQSSIRQPFEFQN